MANANSAKWLKINLLSITVGFNRQPKQVKNKSVSTNRGTYPLTEKEKQRGRQGRISVVREELLALTGDLKDAIILDQMIHCQGMARFINDYIIEERQRLTAPDPFVNQPNQKGWFYKTADQLSIETQLHLSKSNMRVRLLKLVEANLLHERTNPAKRWDKKLYYQVPVVYLDKRLQELDFRLQGWLIKCILDPNGVSKARPSSWREVRTSNDYE